MRPSGLRRHAPSEAEVWIGLGDPMRAGAPLGLLGQAVRWAMGINGAAPLGMQQQMIRARVERVVNAGEVGRVAEFLGELVGVPFSGEHSVQLRAARQDPMLMADQMLRAWEDWLMAESSDKVIILVFEDVHWGDLPTVKFVDAALRNLGDRPIFVLALGRPEVHELFPRLWAERGAVEIHLRQLPRKPCEALVRQVLGEDTNPELVTRIVDRAEGNAFHLEELIRTVAEGTTDLPPSVIAILQLRLSALPDRLRLALRAGSVFGGLFFSGAVTFLLGEQDSALVQAQLAELAEREWITRARHSRFVGEVAYTFRHELVREAAYATLTETDRMLGHRLAADWLERAGETEAIVIAEHCERGGDRERAIGWYQRAAEQALESNDLEAAIARAERAVDCGAKGSVLGSLRVLQAEAHNWRAEFSEADRCGQEAIALLAPGSPFWAHAVHQASWANMMLQRQHAKIEAFAEQLLTHAPGQPLSRLYAIALAYIATHLLYLHSPNKVASLLEALESAQHLAADPVVAGTLSEVHGRRQVLAGNPAKALEFFDDALAHYERAGDARRVCLMQENRGWVLVQTGELDEAEGVLRHAAASATRLRLFQVRVISHLEIGLCLAGRRRYLEAITLARSEIESLAVLNNSAELTEARIYLTRFLASAGDFEGAKQEGVRAVREAADMPTLLRRALAAQAYALIGLRELEAAVDAAKQGLEILETMGGADDWDAYIRLAHAESLHAAGDLPATRASIASARARLRERSKLIDSESVREVFLSRVPEHARTLRLAREWLGEH